MLIIKASNLLTELNGLIIVTLQHPDRCLAPPHRCFVAADLRALGQEFGNLGSGASCEWRAALLDLSELPSSSWLSTMN